MTFCSALHAHVAWHLTRRGQGVERGKQPLDPAESSVLGLNCVFSDEGPLMFHSTPHDGMITARSLPYLSIAASTAGSTLVLKASGLFSSMPAPATNPITASNAAICLAITDIETSVDALEEIPIASTRLSLGALNGRRAARQQHNVTTLGPSRPSRPGARWRGRRVGGSLKWQRPIILPLRRVHRRPLHASGDHLNVCVAFQELWQGTRRACLRRGLSQMSSRRVAT